MNILTPILIVCAIGLIAGVVLSVASIVMAVPVDEKAEKIREVLPGANCGACGYSGCDAYAQALADGAKVLTLCAPGGEEVAQNIGNILGVHAGAMVAKAAVVRCVGNCDNTAKAYDYDGINSCVMASQLIGGPSKCKYGCMGLGDCVKACEYGAIRICNGIAVIDQDLCKSCRKCVAACPKHLIEIVRTDKEKAYVYCSNKDKGAMTRKQCLAGCIGCMKCQKSCPEGAVTISENLASVDFSKCTFCGKCIENCPTKCIMSILQ